MRANTKTNRALEIIRECIHAGQELAKALERSLPAAQQAGVQDPGSVPDAGVAFELSYATEGITEATTRLANLAARVERHLASAERAWARGQEIKPACELGFLLDEWRDVQARMQKVTQELQEISNGH
jgi:hypothetical protein